MPCTNELDCCFELDLALTIHGSVCWQAQLFNSEQYFQEMKKTIGYSTFSVYFDWKIMSVIKASIQRNCMPSTNLVSKLIINPYKL